VWLGDVAAVGSTRAHVEALQDQIARVAVAVQILVALVRSRGSGTSPCCRNAIGPTRIAGRKTARGDGLRLQRPSVGDQTAGCQRRRRSSTSSSASPSAVQIGAARGTPRAHDGTACAHSFVRKATS
jgi:hypothetical protein